MRVQDNVISIREIVDIALRNGYITSAMEAEIGRICSNASKLSVDEYMALDQLMNALIAEQVATTPRKQFINVMEDLVLSEATLKITSSKAINDLNLDLGDIAAYALNRLPPLYATTEEGASYQQERAFKELKPIIAQKVQEAISRSQIYPDFFPERQLINKTSNEDIVSQLSSMLQTYASHFEMNLIHSTL